jgi:hypothetical protein
MIDITTTNNDHRKLLICIYTNKDKNEFAIGNEKLLHYILIYILNIHEQTKRKQENIGMTTSIIIKIY